MKLALALVLLCQLAGAALVTPVQQVVQMLTEMKAKGDKMMDEEKKTFAAYKEWVHDQEVELGFEMKTAESDIGKLTASIEAAEAKINELTTSIAADDTEIATLESDKAAQTSMRETQNEEFLAESQDFAESVDALERAIQVLTAQQYSRPQAEMMLQRLAKSRPALRPALAALLQQRAGQDGAPAVAAYEFQSSGVIDLLEGLLKKFKSQLDETNTDESNRAHAYQMAVLHISNTVGRLSADREEKTGIRAQTKEASAKAQGQLADTKKELEATKKFIVDMQATFAAKSATFAQNQEVREQELEALQKAIEIISNPAVAGSYGDHVQSALPQLAARGRSFLQTRSSRRRASALDRAASLLRRRAGDLSSKMLADLATSVVANPFEKVITMIEDLLAKLKEQAAAEADHKAWCDEQLKDNKIKRDKKTVAVEKLVARIGEMSGDIASMAAEIETLSKEQASLIKSMGEATEVRSKEKAANEEAIADSKAGAEAVKQALVILQEFYSSQGSSLLQDQKQVPEMAAYTGMQSAKGGVIGMLEVIETDFMRVVADTSAAEAQASKEYDSFMKEAEDSKKQKHEKEVKMRLDMDQVEFERSELKKDLASAQEQLDMANKYYDDLKPQCVQVKVSFEERAQRRQDELAALNEAYEILNSHGTS